MCKLLNIGESSNKAIMRFEESFCIANKSSFADPSEPKITTGEALSSFLAGYKKYWATSLEILRNAYSTAESNRACKMIIDKKLAEIRGNCMIYIAAQDKPNIKEPETQTKIESRESKYLINEL